jgi:hypothetical protein
VGLSESEGPGFVLAEGFEENCDNFLAAIVQQRKKNREKGKGKVDSSYFTQAAKVLTTGCKRF